ncbi:MAG: YafY family transcriptional regulator [Rhodocyclaceae bacterium]|jgi:predicted DNA-binding transcriptional regulator YafY|nr:YafY family transcriptional regulator [Rhodocyclaceae bacterium]
MDRTERFYKIDLLLSEQRIVPFAVLEERLGVSRATIKRDLEYMRNRLHAPIVWDRERRGYRFEQVQRGSAQYELPGLWFSPAEIHALLTMQHLLTGIEGGGLLAPHVQPLQARLKSLLDTGAGELDEIQKRIRIIGMAGRAMALDHFAVIASALLRRKRLLIAYYVRARDETSEREISPQRLIHYRENWYLDAWCHLRNELRSFSVDAIRRAEVVGDAVRNIPERTLDAVLGAGYGIFSGRAKAWAKLKFSPQRARWVAMERWHPRQKGSFLSDGSYVLELPYSDSRELVMDVLRHGPEVEVIGPKELREGVRHQLESALQSYKKESVENTK